MTIIVKGGEMSSEEQHKYVTYLESKYPNVEFIKLELSIIKEDNGEEFVDIKYECRNKENTNVPFNRIRRITGYLVGGIDRWNNAKHAELQDRVRHASIGCGCDIDKVVESNE